MIFTTLTENGEIVFNESSIKDRNKVLKDTIKFTKSILDPSIKKHTKFIYEDDKNNFLNGDDNRIFIAHINAWDIIPNARTESEKVGEIFIILRNNCKDIQKKLPKGYNISCDGGDWDDWLIELTAPSI